MKTDAIRLKSCYGEIITCSVKEIINYESSNIIGHRQAGRTEYKMDNKSVNIFHNSLFDEWSDDCKIRSITIYASGRYDIYASYKNRKGSYSQGSQPINAELLKNESI
jgi:hypothetical protein